VTAEVPSLWHNRPFRSLWLGETISQFGDRVTELALPLIAVTMLGASAGQVGALTAAVWLPNLLALFVGAWVDQRTHKRRLLIIADLVRAAVLLSLPICYLAGAVSLAQLYLVALLTGAGQVLFSMAYQSFFVALVPAQSYIDANSKLNLSRAGSFVIGPALGGGLVQALTAPVAVAVDAVSFLGSALLIGRSGPPWAKGAWLAAAELLSSIGVMLLDVSLNALITRVTPDHARGRRAGAYSAVNYGVRPLGALIGGALGTAIGLRPTLVLAGVGGALSAAFLLASPVRRIASLDDAARVAGMAEPACVGAFIRDDRHRVYAQRRTADRRLLPGIWDVVGGHLEAGETPQQALAREIEEETGWRLRRIEAQIADWEWEWDGVVRREIDYLVDVAGDLATPRLEDGKHDAHAWVGPDNLELMMDGRTDGDRRLRDLVARAVRTRLTARLRLEPIGPGHADELHRLHDDAAVARWHGGRWSAEAAQRKATAIGQAWERDGVGRWMAYDRISGDLIGRGGLSRVEVDGAQRLDLGWTVQPELWGRGYATEIGRAGLALAFDDLGAKEVVAFTEPDNVRSRAVMERLGMDGPRDIVHEGESFVLYTLHRR
jgi:RimJ/RimL family protein N-acetyltransferase/MFS family permease